MATKNSTPSSGIGGQAVLEGVMMKNKEIYAVAVRKPDGEIEVDTESFHGVMHGHALKNMPFVRGVFNFIDSLMLGTKALTYSASFYDEEEEKESAADKLVKRLFKDKAEQLLMNCTVAFSIVLAVAIFMVLPYYLSSFFGNYIVNSSLLALVEGIIRILIFVIYVVSISAMKDIKRVYMYHGAEHKCINCIEKGRELTVENVRKSSRQHRRCGTSFMLFVMFVSVVLFIFIQVNSPVYRLLLRIVLVPVIAGISYELIRLAGKSDNFLVRWISAPGMWLQKLTTLEPEDDMIEVAIAAVEAVFDWKIYLQDTFYYELEEDGTDHDL